MSYRPAHRKPPRWRMWAAYGAVLGTVAGSGWAAVHWLSPAPGAALADAAISVPAVHDQMHQLQLVQQQFRPQIEARYRAAASRRHRAVAGPRVTATPDQAARTSAPPAPAYTPPPPTHSAVIIPTPVPTPTHTWTAPTPTPTPTHSYTPPPPTSSSIPARLLAEAETQAGVPYHWGGDSPSTGFDCSGLVYWAAQQIGITNMPRDTYEMLSQGVSSGLLVPTSHPVPGDLAFFGTGHVELVTDRVNTTFGAQHSGTVVGFNTYYPPSYEPTAYYTVT